MGIALSYLKPSVDFEGFLLSFLKGKQGYISVFHETKYDDDSVRPRLNAEKVSGIADEIDSRTKRSRYSGVYKVGEGGTLRSTTTSKKTKKSKKSKKKNTTSTYRRKTPLYAAQQRMESKEEKSEDEEEEAAPKVVPRLPKPSSSSKETRIAAYDFEPQDDTCIEMMEGDKLEILAEEDGGWIEVKNLRTGDSGYVPENYLE